MCEIQGPVKRRRELEEKVGEKSEEGETEGKGSRRGREARERLTGRGQKKTVLKESEKKEE